MQCTQGSVLMQGVVRVQVINQWLWRLWHAASGAAARLCGFLCRVCCTSERPLHFVKVELVVGDGERPAVSEHSPFSWTLPCRWWASANHAATQAAHRRLLRTSAHLHPQ